MAAHQYGQGHIKPADETDRRDTDAIDADGARPSVNGLTGQAVDRAGDIGMAAAGKAVLRTALLHVRRTMMPADRAEADRAIIDGAMQWWQQERPAVLGVYAAIRGEPDLSALYEQLHACGAQLALPVVNQAHQPLRFVRWTPGEPMHKDACGVPMPLRQEPAVPTALLVPCVGFNAACIRLGYGGGYYDRTLAQLPRPATLGIAYDAGEAQFDAQAHDIALDRVLTESRLLVAMASGRP